MSEINKLIIEPIDDYFQPKNKKYLTGIVSKVEGNFENIRLGDKLLVSRNDSLKVHLEDVDYVVVPEKAVIAKIMV